MRWHVFGRGGSGQQLQEENRGGAGRAQLVLSTLNRLRRSVKQFFHAGKPGEREHPGKSEQASSSRHGKQPVVSRAEGKNGPGFRSLSGTL